MYAHVKTSNPNERVAQNNKLEPHEKNIESSSEKIFQRLQRQVDDAMRRRGLVEADWENQEE